MLKQGDPAPDFSLPQDGGDPVALAGLKGKPVVLYFYPKDDTSGCTREAVAFTGLKPEFDALGIPVFGVSRDSVEKHAKFRAKHGLAIGLISDAEGALCEAYGVWVEKSMYGKTHMGIERSTFLIDGEGCIAQVWRKVKVPGHAEAVLAAARAL